MKKVLFITNVPAPYTVKFFNSLAMTVDLTVIYERVNASNRDSKWFCIEERNYNEIILNSIPIGEEMGFSPCIINYLKKARYDVIIVGNYSSPTGILAIEYMRLMNIKFYIHADGGIIGEKSGIRYIIKKHLLGSAIGYFSSGHITDKYFKLYGSKNVPIYHYPFSSVNDIDILDEPLSDEEKKQNRITLGLDKKLVNSFLVISVGNIIPRKGYDILINAISILDVDVELLILGGDPTEDLQKLIDDNNLSNIHFAKFVAPEKVQEYLKAADVFVLSTRYDIWGLVINEALAMGQIVISSNGAVAALELIKEGYNGYIYSVYDIEELKNKIMSVYKMDKELRREMGRNAINSIKSYTIENMTNVYSKIISNLI